MQKTERFKMYWNVFIYFWKRERKNWKQEKHEGSTSVPGRVSCQDAAKLPHTLTYRISMAFSIYASIFVSAYAYPSV